MPDVPMRTALFQIILITGLVACTDARPVESDQFRVTADDYARAERFLEPTVGGLVRNLFVTPHWIGEGHHFWYRREAEGGHTFALVDAATGDRAPLFDHEALARWLAGHGHPDATAVTLPFDSLEVRADRSHLEFRLEGKDVDCTLPALECTETIRPELAPDLLVSPDGRLAARTVDGNIVIVDLDSGEETQVTRDGQPHFGYGIYYGNWKANYVGRARADHGFPPLGAEWSPSGSTLLVTRLDEHPTLLQARQGVALAATAVELLDPAYTPVAQIESAATQLATAEELVGEARRGFELQARNAYLQASSAADRHAVAAERAAAAEQRLELQRARLEGGLISAVQLEQAALETQQQRFELQRAAHDHLLALLRLQTATLYDLGLAPLPALDAAARETR